MSTDCATPFSDEVFTAELAQLYGWQVREVSTSVGLDAILVQRGPSWASQVVVPPFAPYSALRGPLSHAEPGLIEMCARLRAEGVPATLSLSPDLSRRVGDVPGWTRHTRHTYELPTGTFDVVMASCSASTRRNIRRGKNAYVETRDPALIPNVVSLAAEAYQRSGRRFPAPLRGVSDLALQCVERGRAHFMALQSPDSGRMEAGIVALHDGHDTAWYWLAGSVPGTAMSVLVARMAAFLHEKQIRRFDLMGANTPPIAEFKRRFGGELVPYCHLSTPGRGPGMLLAAVRPLLGRLRVWR